MNSDLLPFGPGGLALIAAYILSLLIVGWLGMRARQENSMKDFYLAGRGFGFVVLVLTLYATQYSGNTLFGFTGKTYRIGYAWVMSVHFMTAIIVFYLLFAPELHRLARRKGFITPTDFLTDRFNSKTINLIASVVMIVALSNYLLAQLMAMGRALEGLTRLPPASAYLYGVVMLALIMVIYETMGGLRAVAWTDMIQGLMLLVGFGVLLVLIFQKYGLPGESARMILASEGDRAKILPPSAARCREWFSFIFLVGIGGALYPQAIQRIYAADSAAALRRSFVVMAFIPFTTAMVAVFVGITALANYPQLLEGASSDRVLTVILSDIQQASVFGYWLVVILFGAILAAVMSTADSALLSISSMLTKDLYAGFIKPDASEAELMRLGKLLSWLLLGILVVLAIRLRDATLIKLLVIKFEILIQLAPAFMLGIRWRRLHASAVLAGLLAGIAVAASLALTGHGKVAGIHAGIVGLVVNLVIAVTVSLVLGERES